MLVLDVEGMDVFLLGALVTCCRVGLAVNYRRVARLGIVLASFRTRD